MLTSLSKREAVLDAINECKRLGREEFLAKYGYGKARDYVLVHDGAQYDSKAIAGVAYGYQHPDVGPLAAEDFSGGEATVVPKLRQLGFEVIRLGVPTWIFQGNPDRFDVDGYVQATTTPTWTIRQEHLGNEIKTGDRVFIWRSRGKSRRPGGIVASGHITSEPEVREEDAEALPFWIDQPDSPQLRVRIQIDRVAPEEQILNRDKLANDPLLEGLAILKFANLTNYRVDEAHAAHIEALWNNATHGTEAGADWTEVEITAIVAAYFEMLDHELSHRDYVKAEYRRRLRAGPLAARSEGSLEFKFRNISAILNEADEGYIKGYVPSENVQARLREHVLRVIDVRPTADEVELGRRVSRLAARGKLLKPTGRAKPRKSSKAAADAYERDPAVKEWVLQEAIGVCELCGDPAPFVGFDGEPFLEVHHVKPLGEGGSDTVENATALCPNCHSRVHHAVDAQDHTEELYRRVSRLIRE